MGIFKACDIRGVYPDELDGRTAEGIGRAVGTELDGADCVLCGDVRASTPALRAAVCRGLVAAGTHVVDIGVAPTPVAYWSAERLGTRGVMVVTASHNPPEYNGIKLKLGDLPVTPDDVAAVRRRIEEANFHTGAGRVTRRDMRSEYLDWLAGRFADTGRGRKVLVDCGNGTASGWAPEALRRAGYSVVELFCTPDGRFPNRPPNPSEPGALRIASARLRRVGADMGACFDGDADRVVMLDERGRVVPAEQALILFVRHVLSQEPGGTIVYDLKATRVVEREIRRCGGRPVPERSGHAFIKRRLMLEGAVLAGEVSGHFFFGELGGDDGIYAALRLGEIVAEAGCSLGELRATVPPYFITEDIRIARPRGDGQFVVDRLRERFAGHPQDVTDGVRIEFAGGWALCRPSVTEPAVTVRVEGDSPERRDEIRRAVLDAIAEAGAAGATSG